MKHKTIIGLALVGLILIGFAGFNLFSITFPEGRATTANELFPNSCKTGKISEQGEVKYSEFILQASPSQTPHARDIRITVNDVTALEYSGEWPNDKTLTGTNVANVVNPKLIYDGDITQGSVKVCAFFTPVENPDGRMRIGINYKTIPADLPNKQGSCYDGILNQNEDLIDCGGVCGDVNNCQANKNSGIEFNVEDVKTDGSENAIGDESGSVQTGAGSPINANLIFWIITGVLGLILIWLVLKRR